ncbi:MAG: hypothetical protein ACE5EA_10885 [Nitrospirota bacterium]
MKQMKHRLIGFLSISFISFFLSASVYGLEWQIDLQISLPHPNADGGVAQNRLIAGADPSATDGFDNIWDTVALPSNTLQVYFYHPEYNSSQNYLWRDIRTLNLPQKWEINITSNQDNTPITLAWNLHQVSNNNNCQGRMFKLIDSNGNEVDMSNSTSYTYINVSNTKTVFYLQAADMSSIQPPFSPVNLWSPRQTKRNVILAWSKNIEDNVRYNIFRSITSGNNYIKLNPSPINRNKYIDKGTTEGNTYYYVVTAVDPYGCESGYSEETAVVIE